MTTKPKRMTKAEQGHLRDELYRRCSSILEAEGVQTRRRSNGLFYDDAAGIIKFINIMMDPCDSSRATVQVYAGRDGETPDLAESATLPVASLAQRNWIQRKVLGMTMPIDAEGVENLLNGKITYSLSPTEGWLIMGQGQPALVITKDLDHAFGIALDLAGIALTNAAHEGYDTNSVEPRLVAKLIVKRALKVAVDSLLDAINAADDNDDMPESFRLMNTLGSWAAVILPRG